MAHFTSPWSRGRAAHDTLVGRADARPARRPRTRSSAAQTNMAEISSADLLALMADINAEEDDPDDGRRQRLVPHVLLPWLLPRGPGPSQAARQSVLVHKRAGSGVRQQRALLSRRDGDGNCMSNHLTGGPPATPVIICTVTGHTFSRKVFQGPSLAASSASATACSARDWHRRDARSTEVARYRTLIPEGTGPARRWHAP